jgi:hypothetical protein
MGLGFCYVVEAGCAECTLAILKTHGRAAQVIGPSPTRRRSCASPPAGLRASTSDFGRRGERREGPPAHSMRSLGEAEGIRRGCQRSMGLLYC